MVRLPRDGTLFILVDDKMASVVQSVSSRRERITDDGRAAEEKKHDEACSKETHGNGT